MYIRFEILAWATFCAFATMAQIPELDQLKSSAIPDNASVIHKARRAYYSGENQLAETIFFTELEAGNFEENDYLLFANSLLRDNRPALAKEFYDTYFKKNPIDKKQQKGQLSSILNSKNEAYRRVTLAKSDLINLSLYQNAIYGINNGKLYSYEFDCDQNIANKTEIAIPLGGMKLSGISYFNNGNSAIICLLNSSTNKFGLYLIRKKKEKWSSPTKLLAAKSYNYAFPMVDEKNNMLYFSSDKDGGLGGYDIYQSVIGLKSVEAPINMGELINTGGNEICSYKDDYWFYFSTNGKLSKGGYDIYKYKSLSETNYILLNFLEVNTGNDDLTFLPFSQNRYIAGHIDGNKYLISSLEKSSQTMFIEGLVMDENKNPIENAIVLFEIDNEKGQYVKSDKNGVYTLALEEKQSKINATIMADGFETATVDVVKTKDFILKLSNSTANSSVIEVAPLHIDDFQVYDKNAEQAASTRPEYTQVSTPEIRQTQNIELAPTHITNPNLLTINDLYYIIIGSSASRSQAQDYLLKWIYKFDNLEIMESDKGMFRIGFYAGATEREAKYAYDAARKTKTEVWILRPKK
jgi:hypothetical protein